MGTPTTACHPFYRTWKDAEEMSASDVSAHHRGLPSDAVEYAR